jgi:ribosomal protein S18 acetylase RimI-like enzyme
MPNRDIRRKLEVWPEMFLVGLSAGQIIATVMAGYDGHRGWINYLAVHPNHQRSRIGSRMMNEAEICLRAAGCPKINLQVRRTYKEFGTKDFFEIASNHDLTSCCCPNVSCSSLRL